MIQKDKSFAVISLGIALSSQNMINLSHAQPLDSLSDSELGIEANTNSEESSTDSTGEETTTLNEYQPTFDENSNYRIANYASSFNTVGLSNSNSIGSGNVISDTLNVRSGPSTSNKIIGMLDYNECVEILDKTNDWYKIDYNGKEGYISSANLRLNPIEKGIDVSKWNGSINWKSVKNSGIDYVIIRAGYGTSTVDPQFKTYIEGARDAGLKIGVYWFSYATSCEKAILEAQKCLETISPYKDSISYPVFFDFEYDSVRYANSNGVTISKTLATEMANAFLDTVERQGYTTGIYTNKDFSSTYYTDDLINSNNLWVAQYSSTNTFGKPYSMWQYSEKGSVPGISGCVDLNYTCLNTFNNNTPYSSLEKGVTTANVNFRKGPSTSYSIIANIPKNTTIEIVSKYNDNWYEVKYKNNTGYVSAKYVELNSDTPSTSTEEGTTTANVNFRNSASTSSSIITTIPKNTTIEIIDKSTSGWYKIKYKGVTGYVSSKYVTIGDISNDNNNDIPDTTTQKGITSANVNFRKSASTSSSIISTIPKNTTIEVVSKYNDNWYKVKYKNNTGYVSSKYVKLENDTPSTSTEEGTTTANVNFRNSASTSSSIITTIPKNTNIEIIDKSTSGWYKIEYKGVTGYVSSEYVAIGNNSNDIPTSSTQKGVTSANVNFRKGASTSSSIIATIPKNTTIDVVSKYNDNWYKVKYKNNTGYVSSKYITIGNSTTNTNSNSNNSSSNTNTSNSTTSTQKGITTANLNFRKSSSTSSSIMYTIPKNTTIDVVSKLSSGWYKVKYKGLVGYVSGAYVKI